MNPTEKLQRLSATTLRLLEEVNEKPLTLVRTRHLTTMFLRVVDQLEILTCETENDLAFQEAHLLAKELVTVNAIIALLNVNKLIMDHYQSKRF